MKKWYAINWFGLREKSGKEKVRSVTKNISLAGRN